MPRPKNSKIATGTVAAEVSALVQETQRLREENARLNGYLSEVGNALTNALGHTRRRPALVPAVRRTPPMVKRTRKPITDPEALERRRAALAKARAVRAAKLAGNADSTAVG